MKANGTETLRPQIEPRSVAGVLADLARELGEAKGFLPVPTGFEPLDAVLGGGLHAGELTVVAGSPGVGKTVLTLQWARTVARDGGTAIYACYEHDEASLLIRLLGLELGDLENANNGQDMEDLRDGLRAVAQGKATLNGILESHHASRAAYEKIQQYADRLWLVRCSGAHTGLRSLDEMVARRQSGTTVLFVDYLQKVAIPNDQPNEAEKATRIAEGLKDLALTHRIPVVCVVAGDAAGIASRRFRLNNLSGSAALAYESDVVLVVSDKFSCVSKAHLAYDSVRAKSFKDYSVFSIEKNRGGPAQIDLEFRKDHAYFRFDPIGGIVAERLIDERLYEE